MTDHFHPNATPLDLEAIAWHIKLNSGSATAEDRAQFGIWRLQSPEHDRAYSSIDSLWRQLPASIIKDRERRRQRIKSQYRRPAIGILASALAACVIMATFAIFFPDYLFHPLADYRTHIGERRSLTLPDGSLVHLNTNTALNVSFQNQERRIELLQGEAEFEVAHDQSRPFRVAAGTTLTQALGTRFIIRYEDSAGSITLLQGKVRAMRQPGQSPDQSDDTLQAGQQIIFDPARFTKIEKAEIVSLDAWRHGQLIMNFATLKQILTEINRYRRSPIQLLNCKLEDQELNIAVDITQIDAWLDALSRTLPIKVHRAGPIVIVSS